MIKRVAMAFGVIYLAVGILGMLPFLGGTFGMTPANLMNVFSINLLHNLVHVGLGIGGMAAAGSERNSRQYAQVVGIALMILGVIGISDPVHGVLPLGGVDIALHLLTGAVLAYFGFTTSVARPMA